MIHGKSKISELHPVWRDLVAWLLDLLSEFGISGTLVTVYRSNAEQDRRFALGDTNARAGQSAHNVTLARKPAALAFDFVVSQGEHSAAQRELHDFWRALGFEVIRGGVGPKSVPDLSHVGYPGWRSVISS
jgi:peptidoglycan L-alanyl-D-glutamate endopeptidase CwlK